MALLKTKKAQKQEQPAGRLQEIEYKQKFLSKNSREHGQLENEKRGLLNRLPEIRNNLKSALTAPPPREISQCDTSIRQAEYEIERDTKFFMNQLEALKDNFDEAEMLRLEKAIEVQKRNNETKRQQIKKWQDQKNYYHNKWQENIRGLFEQVWNVTGESKEEILKSFEETPQEIINKAPDKMPVKPDEEQLTMIDSLKNKLSII